MLIFFNFFLLFPATIIVMYVSMNSPRVMSLLTSGIYVISGQGKLFGPDFDFDSKKFNANI